MHNLRKPLHKIDFDAVITQLAHAKLAITLNRLKRVLDTFIKLQRFIDNTFKFKYLTDGRVEGFNNKVTVLNCIAYNYRNFQNFRTRIILTNKLYLNELPITQAA